MEKTMTGNTETDRIGRGSWLRTASWAAAALILLLPLAAMQITNQVVWTASDFAFAAVLLFVPLSLYELVARKTGNTAYRAGVALALVGAFVIVWGSGAVGITDSNADMLYFLALVVGFVGTLVARFRSSGMARAMGATALSLALAGVIALGAGVVPAPTSAVEVSGMTGFFVALFVGSAMLFREAARGSDRATK
ncbi:MAG TPA: hypothetical protein VGB53_16490 [Rubricoccaceae bacterium]|jgi:hypothetical protein